MAKLRVLRIYHAGGDAAHRARERALLTAGVEVTLVVPEHWPGDQGVFDDVPARRLRVRRPGDVNRHSYVDEGQMRAVVRDVRPDVLDIHEEPVSLAARQWLQVADDLPVVMYTAQNLDKRWPPPFAQFERAAMRRTTAFYPCSRQAASVLRGKGYQGRLQVLPLGVDPTVHRAGQQRLPVEEAILGLVGRLVPEKGVLDAVRVLAAVHRTRPARLLVLGEGPEEGPARALAEQLGVGARITWRPWSSAQELAEAYRTMHVVLVPSTATNTWVEQFGRVITEGRANGAVPLGYASGSIPEVVGASGIVILGGDVQALAAQTSAVLEQPALWAKLRRKGQLAQRELTWSKVATEQAQMYAHATGATAHRIRRPSRDTRALAREEFGPPACTSTGDRPFALPMLREGGHGPSGLATVVDLLTGQR